VTGLPWIRLDTGLPWHDKILALLASDSSPALRWQAAFSYVCAIAWSGGEGTDGFIPDYALKAVHGTPRTMGLLVEHKLMDTVSHGHRIRNYELRQVLSVVTDMKRTERQVNAQKMNCVRWHGKDCGCWRQAQ
jgi:hypothetical protein